MLEEMKLRIFLIGLLIICCTSAYSTENASAAGEQTIRSIVLCKGWLYFVSPSGDVIMQERISDVRTIVFSEKQVATDITEAHADGVSLYPNPAQNVLYIQSEEPSDYHFFDIEGKCMFSGKGSTIDVSTLKIGTYLLQINNQTFKFIKQ